MSLNDGKSSAELEREVSEQRSRVEARVNEIRDRLSPGQLLDEALTYTKHGGAHFASNLGQQLSANPLPAALVGVGLAWLIASNADPHSQRSYGRPSWRDDDDYPYAKIPSGGLKRVRHTADDAGQYWSEFQTSIGQSFKAKASALGERAGHFTDEAGKRFAGFIDDSGNRIREFQDESGNRLDDALGWASHRWRDLSSGVGQTAQRMTDQAGRVGTQLAQGTRDLGGTVVSEVQDQTEMLTRQVMNLFKQQPLVAGAMAFAAGAALGAVLPHSEQEDAVLGEQADKVRDKAAETAGELYKHGKDQAAKLYEEVTKKSTEIYEQAKDQVTNGGVGAIRH